MTSLDATLIGGILAYVAGVGAALFLTACAVAYAMEKWHERHGDAERAARLAEVAWRYRAEDEQRVDEAGAANLDYLYRLPAREPGR